jgi:hypothetical protein
MKVIKKFKASHKKIVQYKLQQSIPHAMNSLIHDDVRILASSATSDDTALSQPVQKPSSPPAIAKYPSCATKTSPTQVSFKSVGQPEFRGDTALTNDYFNQPKHDDHHKSRNKLLFDKLQFVETIVCDEDEVDGSAPSQGDVEDKCDDDDIIDVGLLDHRTPAALTVASDYTTSLVDNANSSLRHCHPLWSIYRKELLLDRIDDLHPSPILVRCHDSVYEDELSQGDIESDYEPEVDQCPCHNYEVDFREALYI